MSDGVERSDHHGGPDWPVAFLSRQTMVFRWATNAGYAILLVIMALLPSTSSIAELAPPDWISHAVAYGIQTALVFWACLPTKGRNRALLLGVVGASAFGIVTEALQLFQPSRSVELKDLAANSVGALLVGGLIVVAGRLTRRRDG
jgi:VanZ family protein